MTVRLSDLASLVLAALPTSALILAAQQDYGPPDLRAMLRAPAAAHAPAWASALERWTPQPRGPDLAV
jgi:hypothetical protein